MDRFADESAGEASEETSGPTPADLNRRGPAITHMAARALTAAGNKEPFLPDHRWLDDAELLALPARGPLTASTLFVCTYVATLENLHIDFVELTRIMSARPHGCLLAVNSNFGHAAQPGHEAYIKVPKPPPPRRGPARSRPRKVQGDGTCFNSAVEPVVAIDHPGIPDGKVYFVKCFPSTGEMQVPGTLRPDFSDGHEVLEAFVDYLNELGVGDPEAPAAAASPKPPADAPRKRVRIASEHPNMLNYKFRVNRNSPRILVDLQRLAIYCEHLEALKISEATPPTARQLERFAGWPAVVLPPFPLRETKRPIEDVKVSFRFEGETRAPRINVFQRGKINILGGDSVDTARRIYDFCVRLFSANWSMLVCLEPRRDQERRLAHLALTRAARPSSAARPPLSDADVEAVLGEAYGAAWDPAGFWAQLTARSSAREAAGRAASDPAPFWAQTAARSFAREAADREHYGAALADIMADLEADAWEGDSDSGSSGGFYLGGGSDSDADDAS